MRSIETARLRKWFSRAIWACVLGAVAMLYGFGSMLDAHGRMESSSLGEIISAVGLFSFGVGFGVALLTSVAITLRHISESERPNP